jgi:hypothetical protein
VLLLLLLLLPLQDGATLQLGGGLLSGLQEWSVRTSASAAEQQLAAKLAADFDRARPAPALAMADDSTASFKQETALMDNARVVADRTQVLVQEMASGCDGQR